MENKINLAELLKDCPKGMELYSTTYGTVNFDRVEDNGLISVRTQYDNVVYYYYKGTLYDAYEDAEITLFPSKKVRAWEGFKRPFKDGEILSNGICVCIYNGNENDKYYGIYAGVGHIEFPDYFINRSQNSYFTKENSRLATEEERAKLFDAIKSNGYRWNAETKVLEELIKPTFKVGDKVINNDDYLVEIIDMDIEGEVYGYKSKVGVTGGILFSEQDEWELVPNKFDINTLKPFDKVLVRNKSNEVWTANFYSHYDATSDKPFICVGWSEMNEYRYCIPYEVNNELLGTTNNTEEYGSR